MKLILVLLFPILAFADPASTLAGKNATRRDEKGRSSITTTFRDAQGMMTGHPHSRPVAQNLPRCTRERDRQIKHQWTKNHLAECTATVQRDILVRSRELA